MGSEFDFGLVKQIQDLSRTVFGGQALSVLKYLNSNGMPLHRTTLYRWLSLKPKDKLKPPANRLRRAIEILEQAKRPTKTTELIVAEPVTDLALPSTIACLYRDGNDASSLTLLEKRGVNATRIAFVTGGETLDALLHQQCHIAIAADTLIKERKAELSASGCDRLCTLARAPIVSMVLSSRLKPKSLWRNREALREKRVAFPEGSGIRSILKNLKEDEGINMKLQPMADYNEAIDKLANAKVDILVAWDAYIEEVSKGISRRKNTTGKPTRVLDNLMGNLVQDIAVDTNRADPKAVRIYLETLLDICKHNFSKHGLKPSVRNALNGDKLGRDINPEFVKSATFKLQKVDLAVVIAIWKGELERMSLPMDANAIGDV